MKRMRIIAVALLSLVLLSSAVFSQSTSVINGYGFGDYYFQLKNNDKNQENINAFQFRRLYFTFENNITENLKARFRLEAANDKFGKDTKVVPFVKHAFLEVNNFLPNHKLYIGMAETNAFKNTEDYWGYRSVEKTLLDLNNISSSADLGLGLKGDINGFLHHWLTVMNGPGYSSSEMDEFKKIGYALWVTPVKGMIIEGYFDFEKQDSEEGTFKYAKDFFQASSYNTMKAFVGYKNRRFTLGAEMFRRTNKESGSTDAAGTGKVDVKKQGWSVFGSMIAMPKVKLFARYDAYDPNADDDTWTSATANGLDNETGLLIAGLDFIPSGNIHIMPNIYITSYSQDGKDSDITARITFYYVFDSGKVITN